MRKTLFCPELDRLEVIPHRDMEIEKTEMLKKTLYAQVFRATDILREDFGIFTSILNIESGCKQMVVPAIAEQVTFETGLISATLDYFRLHLPGAARSMKKFTHCQDINAKHFYDYIFQRSLAFLQHNAAMILVWRSVLQFIPASPLNEQVFLSPLRGSLEQSGDFYESRYELSLPQPVPGGLEWQYEHCRQAWQEIKQRLDHGKPAILVLVANAGVQEIYTPVIAYDYRESSPDVIEVDVYVASEMLGHSCIRLDFRGRKVGILAHRAWQMHGSWAGFFMAEYGTETPPLSGARKWWRFFYPLRLYWWIKRKLYLRSLAKDKKNWHQTFAG